MPVSYYSDKIIEIDKLGIDDVVHLTDQRKVYSMPLTYGPHGITDTGTTRLRLNENNEWEACGEESAIACAASAASANTSGCEVYVYPFAVVYAPMRGKNEYANNYNAVTFNVSELTIKCVKVPMPANEEWNTGTALWANQATGFDVVTSKGNALNSISVGYATQPAISGSPDISGAAADAGDAFMNIYTAYNQMGPEANFADKKKYKKHTGDGDISFNDSDLLAVDISGNVFPMYGSVYPYGEFNDDYCIGSYTSSITGGIYGTNTINAKMCVNYPDYLYALMKMQACLFVPRFQEDHVQYINNRTAVSYQYIPSWYVHDGDNPVYGQNFTWNYRLRPYGLLKSCNKKNDSSNTFGDDYLMPKNWNMNYIMKMPAVTWVETPNYDPLPGTVDGNPGPRDLSDRILVLGEAGYGYTGLWSIYNPVTNVGTKTEVSCDTPLQKITAQGGIPLPYVRNKDGDMQPINPSVLSGTQYPLLSKGVNDKFRCCINEFFGYDNFDAYRIEYRVIKKNTQNPDYEVVLQDWQTMDKTLWFSIPLAEDPPHDPPRKTNWYHFTFNKSLADLGVTEINESVDYYYVNYRLYAPWVDPYSTYGGQWGFVPMFNENSAGNETLPPYEYNFCHPFPFDKAPYRLTTNTGDTVESLSNVGYHFDYLNPSITWAGSITAETAAATQDGMTKFRLKSTLKPTATNKDLYFIHRSDDKTMMRVKRMSDGLYLHRPLLADSLPNATGNIWSKFAVPFSANYSMITYTDQVNDTRENYTGWVTWNTAWYLLDKKPGTTHEEFEIEFLLGVETMLLHGVISHQSIADKIYKIKVSI